MRPDHGDEAVNSTTWPDGKIGVIASRQAANITRKQILQLGVSTSAIDRAVARGRLHRVHDGVYSLALPGTRPPRAAEFAALLLHGPSAVLSHHTAARLHGLQVSIDDAVHVTLIGLKRKPRHAGIVVHFTAELHPQEHHRLNGLPVTSVARTVLDLSPRLDDRPLELLVDGVLVHKKTSRTKLEETLDRHPGRPGTPAIRALLAPSRSSSLTASLREEQLFMLFRAADVPMPETNVWLTKQYKPDLLWREQRVIIEYDSEEWHMGRRPFHRDRTRHNDMTATERYNVLHVTKEHTPPRVLVWIAQALARADRP